MCLHLHFYNSRAAKQPSAVNFERTETAHFDTAVEGNQRRAEKWKPSYS